MRDLDTINVVVKSTREIFLISMILPTFIGLMCWAISRGEMDDANGGYLALSGIAMSVFALLTVPASFLLRWDWRTACYGASIFGVASVASLGLYPLLSLVMYSSLPLVVRILLLLLDLWVVVFWCARFVKVYEVIDQDKALFERIYVEEQRFFYFVLQMDKYVLEQKLKFQAFPSGWYFGASLAIGVVVCFFAQKITDILGIPFTSLFWAVVFAPYPAAFLGIATKIWLVCYKYPRRIQASTGKLTYVDMASTR